MKKIGYRQQVRARALLLIVASASTAACGPTLRSRPGKVYAYRSTRACSQGPFVIDLPASGARWGEHIVIQAWSNRVIQGRYDVSVGGQVVTRGTFGKSYHRYEPATQQQSIPGWRLHSAEAPDNRRCVAAAGTQPTAAASPPGSGNATETAPRKPGPAPRATSAPPARKVILFKPLSAAEHQTRRYQRRSYLRYDLLDLDLGKVEIPEYPYCRPSRKNEIAKKTRIRIRLWSETPNDMEGAWFEVRQNIYTPSVSEAKFIAHLNAEQATCLKKARRVARNRRRREKKRSARPTRQRCQMLVAPFDGKVYYYKATRRMDCSCRTDNESTRCWGAGGYAGYLARFRKEIGKHTCEVQVSVKQGDKVVYKAFVTKPCRCAHDLTDRGCWGADGYAAFARRHRAERQRRERLRAERSKREQLRRKHLNQPPPSPRAEKRSPKPSRNARWVPGYWVRIKGGSAAGRWGWIAGWWRVPTADVRQGLTTRSRRRPPPLRKGLRRPTRPSPQAVWAPGYWHWTGRAFVWVHGAWRIPPRAQARWRPARWIRRGPFRILVPGGWIR